MLAEFSIVTGYTVRPTEHAGDRYVRYPLIPARNVRVNGTLGATRGREGFPVEERTSTDLTVALRAAVALATPGRTATVWEHLDCSAVVLQAVARVSHTGRVTYLY